MSPEQFLHHWHDRYPHTALTGPSLRERCPERWMRIHSLPDSRRYAESEEEYAEILRRQHEVIGAMIGLGASYQLIFGFYGSERWMSDELVSYLRALDPVLLTHLKASESGLADDSPLLMVSLRWGRGAARTTAARRR